MADSANSFLYREIYVPNSTGSKWKEISLNTGASASTLQDIKVAESCGGFTYRDSGLPLSVVRNRFIHWKACNDVLELEEESLDLDLYGSKVKFHFQDTAILGGVSIHEAQGYVVVLVPTVASVHRLIFPHPNKLHKADLGYVPTDHPLPSIFYDASIAKCMDARNSHMLNAGGTITSHFTAAASFYTQEGEALFALANSSGNIILVKMPPLDIQGIVQQFELCQTSVMQKLWTGLVPSMMRSGQEPAHTVCSLVIQAVRNEACIFAVCKDHRLRVWSCKTHECMVVTNLLDFSPDGVHVQSMSLAGSGHIIRKLVSTNMADVKLGVHLNFTNSNQFCILQPQIASSRLQISHLASVFGPQEDLIDFCMRSTTLVSLWTSSEGTPVIRTLTFGDEGPGGWMEVLLQPAEVADLNIPPHRDPREVYLERLFQPGRFSKQDIRRALSLQVYSQALDQSVTGEMALNVNTLKQDVTIAVETEIRSAAVDYEMEEDDYYQLQLEQWSKFYSCCIQYHEVGGKLKGLFADGVTGLVGLVRKGCVTYLRPCDQVEELYCSSEDAESSELLAEIGKTDDNQTKRDLSLLFETIRSISLEISEDLGMQFEQELSTNQNLEMVAGQLVDHVILNHDLESALAEGASVPNNLRLIHDFTAAVNMILKFLDLTPSMEDEQEMEGIDVNMARHMNLNKLFTSKVGCDILTLCVEQFSMTRFQLLRDLYLLQLAALRLGNQVGLDNRSVGAIQNDLLPYTANLLRSYLVVKWASQTLAVSTQANSLESNIRQLSSLDISESMLSGQNVGPVLIQKIDHCGASLMELFIQGPGGEKIRTDLSVTTFLDDDPGATWSSGLLKIVKSLASLIWPLSEQFVFPEFLASHCQYLPLQDYNNLLQHWCEFNPASRCFMQGLCYLHFDEPVKAAHCFNTAREGVANESFLRDRLLQSQETQVRKLEVLFYLKVIRQFEEFSAPDVVISLARTAIAVADEDDQNLPTLWSKVFKYQLELGHNTEAYNSMIENPDPSRRKDCLRQLLISLCDRGDLQSLVDFPYTDLEEEVENILESRARCMDLTTHNYYDLLYAFHIFRNNYRKAGSVMYEHGMRLGREVPGKSGLQRQAQCYLAALNALRLVGPQYSWIIKPMLATRPNLAAGDYMRSPKHDLEGEELINTASNFEILELHDIEKEFMLVDARLRLLAKESDPTLSAGSTPGADEMVGLLVKAGMYDRAVIVSRAFDLPLNPVFESLTLRCINLTKNSSYYMRGDNDYTSQAWEWLKTNNLTLTHIAKENSSADEAWRLLQQYLDRYEDRTAQYHRCTAGKLLAHGFSLPAWFINSYKGLNSAELLRLYIEYDLLEEAVSLCVEYIDAVVDTFSGHDSKLFQIKGCLQYQAQTVWLPYTSIDLLRKALQEHRQDIHLGGLHQTLEDKLRLYMRRLKESSDQVCQPTGQPFYVT
ncbi:nuclear pore complex protein Nup160-like isoform X2 [Mercenaria mercenaria]|uniref:nuclear pore complex protein Nup160-like isoform X2 n=1 Tax=Mercenaria mercenaria TaxID=6596 RepID=UPI00234E8D7C|nr:nuclear pore complex protein Nup160-like isoform X2 [Mercenaria mercenaria]